MKKILAVSGLVLTLCACPSNNATVAQDANSVATPSVDTNSTDSNAQDASGAVVAPAVDANVAH